VGGFRRLPLPYLACLAILFSLAQSRAAEAGQDPFVNLARPEVPSDRYVSAPRDDQPKSPAYHFFSETFTAVQVNVDAFGQNVIGDAANEPSLAVDPTDPDKIVIGWRQFDTIGSNFRQAGYGYTTDGGQTWTFPGVIDPGVFRSDPVLDSDSQGRIYYNSLTLIGGNYTCDVFQSSDGGMTWDAGTFAHGGDKQWMAIDKTGGAGDGHIYAYWTSSYSSCPPGFFTRSTDGGLYYEDCIPIPGDPYWGTLAVGPLGELFVFGASGSGNFVVARSSNARYAGQSITWDLSTPVSLGGTIQYGAGPNPGGLAGQAWIAVDPSPSGPTGTLVYALCSVNPPGSDPLDVMFARSTNGGMTWSSPLRLNDDPGNSAYQWFGTMSVSPSGRIDAVWLDTRDDPGGYDSALYYSFSSDDGLTWSPNERLSNSFDPHVGWPQQNKMGDYFHMVSDNEGFRLAWAATFNGEQDVYFGRNLTPSSGVGEGLGAAPIAVLDCDPNPFGLTTRIRYEVPRDAFVTLRVYDTLGRTVATLVEKERQAGSYETRFDARDFAGGVYFYRLAAGEFRATKQVLLLK
jgi:hypothetical protein